MNFALVRRDERLLILLLIVAAVSLTMDPVATLTPAYATRSFHRPDTFSGLLIGAFGMGAVIGSVIPLHDTDNPGRRIAVLLGPHVAMLLMALPTAGAAALALRVHAGRREAQGATAAASR